MLPFDSYTLYVICTDIQFAAGALQTCADHDVGAEVAIHVMRAILYVKTVMWFCWLMPVMPSTNNSVWGHIWMGGGGEEFLGFCKPI